MAVIGIGKRMLKRVVGVIYDSHLLSLLAFGLLNGIVVGIVLLVLNLCAGTLGKPMFR